MCFHSTPGTVRPPQNSRTVQIKKTAGKYLICIGRAQVKVGLTSILTITLIKILISNKVIMCRQYDTQILSPMYHSSIYNTYIRAFNLNKPLHKFSSPTFTWARLIINVFYYYNGIYTNK
jgi:hypothetical protein